MRTDAFDHFCTPLVARFTREEIETMMRANTARECASEIVTNDVWSEKRRPM